MRPPHGDGSVAISVNTHTNHAAKSQLLEDAAYNYIATDGQP